jgi:hypothetical protein
MSATWLLPGLLGDLDPTEANDSCCWGCGAGVRSRQRGGGRRRRVLTSPGRTRAAPDTLLAAVLTPCRLQGDVLCCDGCRVVYHAECLGLPEVPEDEEWFCPLCVCAKCGAPCKAAHPCPALATTLLPVQTKALQVRAGAHAVLSKVWQQAQHHSTRSRSADWCNTSFLHTVPPPPPPAPGVPPAAAADWARIRVPPAAAAVADRQAGQACWQRGATSSSS